MELTNIHKKFLKEMELYVTQEEIEALDMIFSSAQIETYEHTMDNSTLETSFGKTLHNLRKNGYMLLGIGKAPWAHQDRDMAVVFEDSTTFQRYWYHTTQFITSWWQEQIAIYLGKDI